MKSILKSTKHTCNSGAIRQYYGNNACAILIDSSPAGLCGSPESSEGGPSTSSGQAGVESSRNEPEVSKEPEQEINLRVVSLLSKL